MNLPRYSQGPPSSCLFCGNPPSGSPFFHSPSDPLLILASSNTLLAPSSPPLDPLNPLQAPPKPLQPLPALL